MELTGELCQVRQWYGRGQERGGAEGM